MPDSPYPFVPADTLPDLLQHPDGSPWCGPCETRDSGHWLGDITISMACGRPRRLDTRRPEVQDHLVRWGHRHGYDWEHLRDDPEGLAAVVRWLGEEVRAGRIQPPEVPRET